MSKVRISAPGKLLLFGEHAVVYNRPSIVTTVGQRLEAIVSLTDTSLFTLHAQGVKIDGYEKQITELGSGEIPKGAQFIEHALKNVLIKYPQKSGFTIQTQSEFSSLYGFGSSSASTACIIKAFSELCNLRLTNKELFALAYKTVLDVQGNGSGFDVASAIYGGVLYFVTGGKVIQLLKANQIPIIIGYSGMKADTATIVNQVKQKKAAYPEKIERIFEAIKNIVDQAKQKILENDWERVGKLMNFNQEYLRDLGVSTEKLESMISASIKAGAYGAKLSGAGGGDCMIAIAPTDKIEEVKNAISDVDGQIIDVDTGVEGVRIES